jgi:hypothetical protein
MAHAVLQDAAYLAARWILLHDWAYLLRIPYLLHPENSFSLQYYPGPALGLATKPLPLCIASSWGHLLGSLDFLLVL